MKATGIVRNVDSLGRIVIPKEIRKTLFVDNGDSLEIFKDEESILLRKYSPGCAFCGNIDNSIVFKDIHICKNCINDLKALDK